MTGAFPLIQVEASFKGTSRRRHGTGSTFRNCLAVTWTGRTKAGQRCEGGYDPLYRGRNIWSGSWGLFYSYSGQVKWNCLYDLFPWHRTVKDITKKREKNRTMLSMEDVGEGPSLVLLHAVGTSGLMWWQHIPRLARRFRVLTPDLPGHGRSPKPEGSLSIQAMSEELYKTLHALNLSRFDCVGLSSGPTVAVKPCSGSPIICFIINAL